MDANNMKFSNRLVHESSLYLQQHAHNPVDWYPWGEEALQKAKMEDKPILLSIGYAACHWCHVMERESFENEEVAAYMNSHFINIKLDREERPDLDHIYMDAVQAITGSGGWPLNVFLTPHAKPFYGGTYFPPIKLQNRSSWMEVLKAVNDLFTNKRNEVESQAENLTAHIDSSNEGFLIKKQSRVIETDILLATIAQNIMNNADLEWGGFGNAPKFPQTFTLQALLRHYYMTGNKESLKHVLLSAEKMSLGGMYDQVGGGFARYSTDAEWFLPHFEKMLYDNALILNLLSEIFQLTGNDWYASIIEQVFVFLENEMTHASGGLYAALDADSEGKEGLFYVWTMEELRNILKEDFTFCESYYNILPEGNWEEGHNILYATETPTEYAKSSGLNLEIVISTLDSIKRKLNSHRQKRVRPQTDDKMLTAWNALMVTALCKAFSATGELKYLSKAQKVISFLEENLLVNGETLFHTFKDGKATINGFLDDYAYLIQAYINLQEATGNLDYLSKAKKLTHQTMMLFFDTESSFFYFTPKGQKDTVVRKFEVFDNAVPSGNAVMCGCLLYLSRIFDRKDWSEIVDEQLAVLLPAIQKYPQTFGCWAQIVQWKYSDSFDIVITGRNIIDSTSDLLKKFIPFRTLLLSNTPSGEFPLLAGKNFSVPVAMYVCKEYACSAPLFELKELYDMLPHNPSTIF